NPDPGRRLPRRRQRRIEKRPARARPRGAGGVQPERPAPPGRAGHALPHDLAYLGQLRGVYGAFGVPMPLMYQRGTATLLDSNGARFLVRHDVALEQLQAQDEAVLNQLLASQLPPGVDAAMQDAALVLQERMERLAASVAQIDATLES